MAVELAATIATTVVSQFLVPLLKKGVEKFKEDVAANFSEAAGKETSEVAQKVWERVRSAFSSDRDKATLADFEEDPEAASALVEKKLTAKLQEDNTLTKELQELVQQPVPGAQGNATQVVTATNSVIQNLQGSTFSGGTTNITGMSYGSSPPQNPPAPKPGREQEP
jgi:predicted ATP-grasp superfamily ATP-dependent carboligase